jgi:outer membrane protein TolC
VAVSASLRSLLSCARSSLVATAIVVISACRTPGIPTIDGVAGAPTDRAAPWPVPAAARTPPPPAEPPSATIVSTALRQDSATAGSVHLSLADVLDLALRRNPTTRESWENAIAAADLYGAAKGARYPTINASVNLSRSSGFGTGFGGVGSPSGIDTTTLNGARSGGGGSGNLQVFPAISFSWLLFDHGARAGTIEAAKQQAIATNLAHNLTLQNVVLQAESSLFNYLAARALRDAQLVAVKEATTDTAAAEAKLRYGVGILEDVYQTRTALAQARLQLVTFQGNLVTAKGNLATALGFPANADFDVDTILASDSVATIGASVDTLINRAITKRPDLAQARASAEALAAQVRVARSAGYPSLTLSSNGGLANRLLGQQTSGNNVNYTLQLGLQIPIFNGFARQYDARSAQAQYESGLARMQETRQQIAVQVFTSYSVLHTAVESVKEAAELVASATLAADGALGRYSEGIGAITDLVLARSALATARAQSIQARWEWQTALAQLAHDVGSLDVAGRPNLPLGPSIPAIRR